MKHKKYSHKNIIFIIIVIVLFIIFLLSLRFSNGSKDKKTSGCYLVGAFDVDSYELYFPPESLSGCKGTSLPETRPLQTLALIINIPKPYAKLQENNDLLKAQIWPINNKVSDDYAKVKILISYRRIILPFSERKKFHLSRRSHLVASDIKEFEKYQEDKHQFYYVNDKNEHLVDCFDLYGKGARCKLEYNIKYNNDAKGLVRYSFDEKEMNDFYYINNYVHVFINSLIRDKVVTDQ